MMRVPKMADDKWYPDFKGYKLLHKMKRPEGSDKGLRKHETRLTITIRKELLQKLETAAYWKKRELMKVASPAADYQITVQYMVNEILETYFDENPVEDMPAEEYMYQTFERANKFNRRFLKQQGKKT